MSDSNKPPVERRVRSTTGLRALSAALVFALVMLVVHAVRSTNEYLDGSGSQQVAQAAAEAPDSEPAVASESTDVTAGPPNDVAGGAEVGGAVSDSVAPPAVSVETPGSNSFVQNPAAAAGADAQGGPETEVPVTDRRPTQSTVEQTVDHGASAAEQTASHVSLSPGAVRDVLHSISQATDAAYSSVESLTKVVVGEPSRWLRSVRASGPVGAEVVGDVPADRPPVEQAGTVAEVGSASGEAATPSDATPPPVVVLVNPVESRVPVHYLVRNAVHSLDPGQSHDLGPGRWLVQFHRGGDFGEAQQWVAEGMYRFEVSRKKGWDLISANGPSGPSGADAP